MLMRLPRFVLARGTLLETSNHKGQEGIYRNGREGRKRRINHRGHRGTQRQGLYRRVRRERGEGQIPCMDSGQMPCGPSVFISVVANISGSCDTFTADDRQ